MHCLLLIVSSSSSQVSASEGTDLKGSSADINLHFSGLIFGKYINSLNLLWNQGLNVIQTTLEKENWKNAYCGAEI